MTHVEITNKITPIVNKYPIKKVILFGSQARSEATDKSDIDLILDSGGQLKGFEAFTVFGEIIELFEESVDIFDLREVNKNTAFYSNVVKEGVVLYER